MFQGGRGYQICRILTYGLEDMNFRSLGIFLKMKYEINNGVPRVMI